LWPEATEAIGKYGAYLSIANRQAEIMVRISAEFGFTPASRGRISMPKPEEPDPFDRLETPADPG
ncbi:MAG: P27 family phage terminase small subunit, partial [Bauldia sp.]|nr:P27 family phage terminase small subunit [Bauldia sp.]